MKRIVLFLIVLFLVACQKVEPWHDPYSREVHGWMNHYLEQDFCEYNLSDDELQQRIEWFISGNDTEKYRAGKELVFSADKAVPVIMRNIDRAEFWGAGYVMSDNLRENGTPRNKENPLIRTLEMMTNMSAHDDALEKVNPELAHRREIDQWKHWYELSQGRLGCNVYFGLTHPFAEIVVTKMTDDEGKEFKESVEKLSNAP